MSAGLWLEQAVGHHVDGDLSRMDAEAVTAKIKAFAGVAWVLLNEAHHRKAHKAMGYATWGEYVEVEFDMSRSRSYQLINQARVITEISEAVSTMVDITERDARDILPVLEEAKADVVSAVEALPADATDEDKRSTAKGALDATRSKIVPRPTEPTGTQTTRTTETTTTTFDPETGEIVSTNVDTATPTPETTEQRDAREAEQRRLDRNVNFGKYLIGMWATLGDGDKPIAALLDGWVPEECPMWLVDAHKPVFTPDGIRAVAAVMEKLATEWESRV